MSVGRIPGASGIPTTTVLAKGDLIAGTATNAVTNLSVGSDGQTLVANSFQTTGLAYTNNFAAGKNAIINGAFNVWQRGTSFTCAANTATYTADRFFVNRDGTGATVTVSQQAFTPGTAPVAGYEGTYFYRYAQSVAGSGATYGLLGVQRIEDCRTYAGTTVTWSFWAKADSARNINLEVVQNFGTGGSATTGNFIASPTQALTTSWVRYSVQVPISSVAGKTIGANSYISFTFLDASLNATKTVDTWGWQVEAGSVATAFQTATGTLQGELTACQRYYYRQTGSSPYSRFGQGPAASSTSLGVNVFFPVTMRTYPSSTIDYANLAVYDGTNIIAVTSVSMGQAAQQSANLSIAVASGAVTNRYYDLMGNNNAAAYIGFSAEL